MDLYERAKNVIPGGVNSPVRAFQSVGMDPIFFERADGPYIYDVDGNKYIDYIDSWGPMILGHRPKEVVENAKKYLDEAITFGLPTEVEVEMAELFTKFTGTEMVRMVNSGTEATMSAIRLARGYTGRDMIIKFEGCYHGHSDGLLVKSGSGTLTYNSPSSLGVPKEITDFTLVCEYNNIEDVKEKIYKFRGKIACVIIEPVAGNMGVVPADKTFIKELRKVTEENGILLIFDEVITGFRTQFGSIAKDFDVKPDLFCFGKIIGGGLPVGAFAGPREIMNKLSPVGGVYQAGTLSGNPLAMKMGRDTLLALDENRELYDKLEQLAIRLGKGFEENLRKTGIKGKVTRYKSMMSLFFGDFGEIKSYNDVKNADTKMYAKYFRAMVHQNFMFAPAQFEAIFFQKAHTEDIIDRTIEANLLALKWIKDED
ncbi:MAG: glutamate-1-semialdehyde 2,1-aminomutase [Ezakiella sp.]|nr:glutamate-1-semialdehyde 2,1-aminomutase [Ezakiella sp.]MDD7472270.1 glutamate-1-semialdehyde 2,1-aminomutase [Bacillota bacterium]MDY3923008.1 glutamate-1-semialdehyde 2,1-aminomutase [Ezakiella sp.]